MFLHSDSQMLDDGLCDGKTRAIEIDTKDLVGRKFQKDTEKMESSV
jgi:hypothetical protein